ncbi:MAG: nuclear transport factor 2 family protein [Silicimonas sp.]|nr:nuclear transport factor 2 family protein [Silicimonas sp.]NNF91192.1 nuclear transport factor 2 family protein [Boseongicola sp.]RZW07082.1 MAG: nuclear transport factor 2 family protein [Paracoccaceae bacterium]MBT8426073.1 nuclear transport factor 2 family protein [Silicimonas sp.]NND21524.1 nuclear transport factor 2 family protein [Silicimonas sp.]
MLIYTEMEAAMRTDDADRYAALLAENFEYVRHKSQDTIGREAMRNLLTKVWRPGNRTIEDLRCLYENDDILVVHTTLSFASGSREGAMIVHHKRDGLIVRAESGVSDLSDGARPGSVPQRIPTHSAAPGSGPIPHETSI